MTHTTKVTFADLDDPIAAHMTKAVLAEGLQALTVDTNGQSAQSAAWHIVFDRPDVVMIGQTHGEDHSLELTAALDALDPTLPTVMVAPTDADMWQQALRAGARDLLDPYATDDEFDAVLHRAMSRAAGRQQLLGDTPGNASSTSLGRMITVVSPKGGCGKTMLATNLAYALHQSARGRVLLVDLDLQFGDVAGAMSLRPEYTVANAIGAAEDPTAIRSFLTAHSSGLFCLCAPTNPAEADLIDPDRLNRMLALLRGDFDWVIVDTAAGIGEVTLGAIEQSTDVLLVTTTDLSAIQAMRKAVIALDQIGLDEHRRWYVLNRANAKVGLDQDDIEKSIGLDIDACVPSSKSVPTAMNQGIPVLADDPRSPASRSLDALLTMMATGPAVESRGWLQRIRA